MHYVIAYGMATMLFALPVSNVIAADTHTVIGNLIKNNCLDCHDADEPKGKLDLSTLAFPPPDPASLKKWVSIYDRVKAGEMPPKRSNGTPRMNNVTALTEPLGEILLAHDKHSQDKYGRVTARRLSRFEYQRSMEAVLGIAAPISDEMPNDLKHNSYDTVTQLQQMSQYQMSQTLEAARLGLNAALTAITAPEKRFAHRYYTPNEIAVREYFQARAPMIYSKDEIIVWSASFGYYGRMQKTAVPESGWYRISADVRAINPPSDNVIWCGIYSGFLTATAPSQYWVGGFSATPQKKQVSFDAWIQAGHLLQVTTLDSTLPTVPLTKLDNKIAKTLPGVVISNLNIERLAVGQSAQTIQKYLFGDLPVTVEVATTNDSSETFAITLTSKQPDRDLARLITNFATRAFRRPVTTAEVKPYIDLALNVNKKRDSLSDGLLAAYRALLVAPQFLYLTERPGALDDFALASRLSYFLTGAPPDDVLLALAAQKRLQDSSMLRAQAERLLQSDAFSDACNHFVDQWLSLSDIDATMPDRKAAPTYDDFLKMSMLEETHGFIQYMMQRNAPAVDLVASDYSIMNSRLAKHYGIPWTADDNEARVVQLPKDAHRGGVLTQASILKVTANGSSTSPITRGVWVLERLMGVHVPPPPDNVPAIEPDVRGANTIREILERHRADKSCATCHVKIDPPGFALETFDVIGKWRNDYGGDKSKKQPINSSSTLVDGRSFSNIDSFRALLATEPDRIARTFVEHLATYATGAHISFADREDIDVIVKKTAPQYGLRSLLLELVTSPIFTNK